MNKNYNTLVISGGAIKGFSALGVLQYMYDNNLLSNIERYYATSVGAMICYLLAIGYTPIEIMVYVCTSQVLSKFVFGDILSLSNGDGMYDWNIISNFIEQMTIDKIGKFLTLSELKEIYKKEITMITYNFTNKKQEEISYKNHPNMSCITALRLSSNLPLVFSRYKYLNCYYLDGGFVNNLPINLITENDICFAINLNFSSNLKESSDFKIHYYVYNLLCTSTHINQKKSIEIAKLKPNCDLISLDVDVDGINFKIDKQEQLNIFSKGYKKCKEYMDKKIDKIIENEMKIDTNF